MPVIINGDTGITQPNEFNSDSTFGFKNRLVNGGMVIDQRNNGASVTANAGTAFTCDRWRAYLNGGGTMTFQRSSIVPNNTFKNSILVTVTVTGTPSEAATTQTIEGFNIADLGFGTSDAKPLVASFWIRSSVTGTYCFSLRQGSGARSFVSNFSISSANTWQQVVIPIPGDTTGTYDSTNGAGFIFEVCFGASTLITSTTDAWQSGNFVCTSSQVNLASTNGATLYITGCQLEVGTVATSFEFRSIGQELFLCQRYFEKTYSQSFAPGNTTGYAGGAYQGALFTNKGSTAGANEAAITWQYKVVKRAVPTITFYAPNGGNAGQFTAGSTNFNAGINGPIIGDSNSLGYGTATSGGNDCYFHMTASSEL